MSVSPNTDEDEGHTGLVALQECNLLYLRVKLQSA